jgi:hypothetical protein
VAGVGRPGVGVEAAQHAGPVEVGQRHAEARGVERGAGRVVAVGERGVAGRRHGVGVEHHAGAVGVDVAVAGPHHRAGGGVDADLPGGARRGDGDPVRLARRAVVEIDAARVGGRHDLGRRADLGPGQREGATSPIGRGTGGHHRLVVELHRAHVARASVTTTGGRTPAGHRPAAGTAGGCRSAAPGGRQREVRGRAPEQRARGAQEGAGRGLGAPVTANCR